MPPPFASGAREVVAAALAEARLRGDRRIGTEHLLLGVLRLPDTEAARALGVDLATARDALAALDHDALAALGIVVGVPPARSPDDGPGLWPAGQPVPSLDPSALVATPPADGPTGAGSLFGHERRAPTPAQIVRLRSCLSSGARGVLGQAIDAAPTGRRRHVTTELVLLALLARQPPDPAAGLFDRLGVDRAATRSRLGQG